MKQLNHILTGLVVIVALSSSVYAQAQLEVVKTRRDNYGPGPLAPAAIRQMLTEIAADLTAQFPGGPYGILEKTTGTQCAGISCDIVCTGNGPLQRQFDVLINATGEARPTWSPVDPSHQIVRPCLFGPVQPPPPPPPPSGLEKRVAELERQYQEVHEHFVLLSADVNAAKNAIEQLDRFVSTLFARMQSLQNEIASVRTEQIRLQNQLDTRCVVGRVFGVINVRSCPEPR